MLKKFMTAGGRIWKPGDAFEIKEFYSEDNIKPPIIASLKELQNKSGEIYAAGAIDKAGKQIGIIFPCGAVMETDGVSDV